MQDRQQTLDMSIYQMMMLRSLLTAGCPEELLLIFRTRCDLPEQGWDQLVSAGFVTLSKKRWSASAAGKRAYNVQKRYKWF